MTIVLITILIICVVVFCYTKKNEKEPKEKNFLLLVIFVNTLWILLLELFKVPIVMDDNIWGIGLFILSNIIIIALSKKISEKLFSLIIGIIFYFLIILIIPTYTYDGHEHVIDEDITYNVSLGGRIIEFPTEVIEEYTLYYNCYKTKILKYIK